jgi:uncharacterized protein CbrC (UPF0167 family)
MSQKVYTRTFHCRLCGQTTGAKSGYSERELDQHELAYSICPECARDPKNIEKVKNLLKK